MQYRHPLHAIQAPSAGNTGTLCTTPSDATIYRHSKAGYSYASLYERANGVFFISFLSSVSASSIVSVPPLIMPHWRYEARQQSHLPPCHHVFTICLEDTLAAITDAAPDMADEVCDLVGEARCVLHY